MKSKIKRSLSLLLAAILMISLAACGATPAQPESSSAAPSESAAATPEAPASSEAAEAPAPGATESAYEEKLTIEFANVTPVEGYDYTSGDPYAQFWADKFNWELDVTAFAWDTWNETIRVWANSGDMPDVSIFQYNRSTQPDAASWAEQGLVKRLPDDWKTRWPNAAAVFDKTSLGPETEQAYGGVYFLPRARFDQNLPGDPLPNHQLVYIRKDWAEAVGFEIKDAYKVSEIMEYARLVKEQDPGGLGANLVPITATPSHAMQMYIQHNSTFFDSFYKDTDGAYK